MTAFWFTYFSSYLCLNFIRIHLGMRYHYVQDFIVLSVVPEQEQDKAQEQLRRERELRKKKEEEDSLTLEQTKEQVVHQDVLGDVKKAF